MRHTFISKHNSKCKSQPFLLLITNDKKWHYFVVKNLYALFRVITPSHIENSYCLNELYLCRAENQLKEYGKVFKNHDNCYIELPNKSKNILKRNHRNKSMKPPIYYLCWHWHITYPEKPSATININKHTASGYS